MSDKGRYDMKNITTCRNLMMIILAMPLMVVWPASAQTNASTTAVTAGPMIIPDYRLPPRVSLCGVDFPLDNLDVYQRLDLEFTIAVHAHAQVYLWLRRAGQYFPHIEKRLAEEGLPNDLKYLAVAESDLRPHAYSPARASGTWQFISETGTRYGLKNNQHFDERLNFEQSTEAAILYLKKLHRQFGDWLLAMAAYNCGEGRIANAIAEQGVQSYFRMDLPYETERYIYRIAAIKLILDNPKAYGFQLAGPPHLLPSVDRVAVNVGQEIHFTHVAKAIGTDYKVLKELNPEIKGKNLPRGSYHISVPKGVGAALSSYLSKIPAGTSSVGSRVSSSGSPQYYTVQKGDTLSRIAIKTGVPMDTIKKINNIRGSKVMLGQRLRLR
jgi:membrane-bound lytic murein transglycosylase D